MRKIKLLLIIVSPLLLLAACTKPIVSSGPSGSSAYESEAQRQAEGMGGSASGISEQSLSGAGAGGAAGLSPSEAAAARKAFENDDIYFEYDSALLTPQAQQILRDKAQFLKDNAGVQIIIEGHCDERGTNEYNLALGEQRARTTQQYLEALGIAASRITTVSYGEERPVDIGHTEEAWVKNRRAHFLIVQ